uniref:Uncharacterized protein n=1 Tax=Aegilops tauschii TaxID=37682 RepID=R7VYZ5_AEGTA
MSSVTSSTSTNSNPFADANPPDVNEIRNLNIFEQVPVRLSQADSSYYTWKTYFSLVFGEHHLIDHVDGTVDSNLVPEFHDWSTIDTTIIRCFYLTISPDLFQTVVQDGDDACAVWTKLNGLFTDNQLQRRVFLQQDFFGCHEDNTFVDDYCRRLKTLADELHDIGAKIDDGLFPSTLTAGLNVDFGNAAANLDLIPHPSFAKFVVYLRLEERQIKQTDNEKEFDNLRFRTFLLHPGIVFRLTCPYTSQQNGRAERVLRTLNDCVRTLLFHANVPPHF